MENVMPRYKRPIIPYKEPVRNMDFWDEAEEAFDEKRYKDAVIAVLNYINPEVLKDKDLSGDIVLEVIQGSAQMKISLTKDFFKVEAPFLKITEETNKIPLLRRVGEVNFSPLQLEQIRLKDNLLHFEYQTALELAQPDKIYGVLRNIAISADKYDDVFIEKYKAAFYVKPKITKLSKKDQTEVWKQISQIFEDYTNYTKYFKEKRYDDFVWDITILSLLKLSNMPYVNGKLRVDLIRYISILLNTNIHFKERLDKGVNFMKKLMEISKKDWLKNIYFPHWFISERRRASHRVISDKLKEEMKIVRKYEKLEKYMDLAYFIQRTLLLLIYYYNLPQDYTQIIHQVLEKTSGMEPEDAVPLLINTMEELAEIGNTDNEKNENASA